MMSRNDYDYVDFGSIRNAQRTVVGNIPFEIQTLLNDASQATGPAPTPRGGANTMNETRNFMDTSRSTFGNFPRYDRGSKACIPQYSIKKHYGANINQFFSAGSQEKLAELRQIKEILAAKPAPEELLQQEEDKKLKQSPSPKGPKSNLMSPKSNTGSNLSKYQPNPTEAIEILDQLNMEPINANELAFGNKHNGALTRDELDDQVDMMNQIQSETLQGPVKSRFALRYKFDTEQAIEKSLDFKKLEFDKRKTKGLFQNVSMATSAGNWMNDRNW